MNPSLDPEVAQPVPSPGYRILVINPGSTSTKVGVYLDAHPLLVSVIRHQPEELAPYKHITEQHEFRRNLVLKWLEENNIPFVFDAIIGRGGLTKPIPGGVYRVNRKMCYDTFYALRKHACNLGCLIAKELAKMQTNGCQAYIADPAVVDKLLPEARISGSPLMPRLSIWHALNQRAIARRHAKEMGTTYDKLNLIVCHLGGGISIAAHQQGRAVDANNALDGEGPLSPERAGTLPASDLIHLCFSGRYTEDQLKRRVAGKAGLMAHLGTTDVRQILTMKDAGDKRAALLIDAMIFHTAKSIAAEGAVLKGKIDAILITGGMAYSDYITNHLRERVDWMAPVYVYPGEDEMEALALNALAVLKGERVAKEYE